MLLTKDGLAESDGNRSGGVSQAEVGKDALEEVLREEAKGGAQALRLLDVERWSAKLACSMESLQKS